MADNAGYIKISRKLFSNPIWTERRTFSTFEAWLDLIQAARYEDGEDCKRGQLAISQRALEKRWLWNGQKVRRTLKEWEASGMIEIDTKTAKVQTITLVNYDYYNGGGAVFGAPFGAPNDQETNGLGQEPAQDLAQFLAHINNKRNKINNNIKEENLKEEKKMKPVTIPEFVGEEFAKPYADWLEYKRARKESYKTDRSRKAFYNRLVKLSGGSGEKAAELIEYAMAQNWAGIYPIKDGQDGRASFLRDDTGVEYKQF